MSYTKGPWKVQPGTYTYGPDMTTWEVSEADARLCEAAPALLEAAKYAKEVVNYKEGVNRFEALDQLERAITAAEGGTP